jgi:hypothetical protein
MVEHVDNVLNKMGLETTFNGKKDIEISDRSKELMELLVHQKIINESNSGTLKHFLAHFYKPNRTDVPQLISGDPRSVNINLDDLKKYWSPITSPDKGIELSFPNSDNPKDDEWARLSAYIILWYTIIVPALQEPRDRSAFRSSRNRSRSRSRDRSRNSGGSRKKRGAGRKRLSGVRRSSNNKRYKSRGLSNNKRCRPSTRRRRRRH